MEYSAEKLKMQNSARIKLTQKQTRDKSLEKKRKKNGVRNRAGSGSGGVRTGNVDWDQCSGPGLCQ